MHRDAHNHPRQHSVTAIVIVIDIHPIIPQGLARNLEVADPVQNLEVADPVQNLVVADPVQNLVVADPVQNLEVADPVQNLVVDTVLHQIHMIVTVNRVGISLSVLVYVKTLVYLRHRMKI